MKFVDLSHPISDEITYPSDRGLKYKPTKLGF